MRLAARISGKGMKESLAQKLGGWVAGVSMARSRQNDNA
jgi:hypothetical protein